MTGAERPVVVSAAEAAQQAVWLERRLQELLLDCRRYMDVAKRCNWPTVVAYLAATHDEAKTALDELEEIRG